MFTDRKVVDVSWIGTTLQFIGTNGSTQMSREETVPLACGDLWRWPEIQNQFPLVPGHLTDGFQSSQRGVVPVLWGGSNLH